MDKRVEINNREAEAVRTIFDLWTPAVPRVESIVSRLNRDGRSGPRAVGGELAPDANGISVPRRGTAAC